MRVGDLTVGIKTVRHIGIRYRSKAYMGAMELRVEKLSTHRKDNSLTRRHSQHPRCDTLVKRPRAFVLEQVGGDGHKAR